MVSMSVDINEWFLCGEQKWRWVCRDYDVFLLMTIHRQAQSKKQNDMILRCHSCQNTRELTPVPNPDRSQDFFILWKRCQWYGEPVWLKGYSKHISHDFSIIGKSHYKIQGFPGFPGCVGTLLSYRKRDETGKKQRTRERINKCLLPLHKNHANNTETTHVRVKTTLNHVLLLATDYTQAYRLHVGPERASSLPPAAAPWTFKHKLKPSPPKQSFHIWVGSALTDFISMNIKNGWERGGTNTSLA